jgi:hypothetical protein
MGAAFYVLASLAPVLESTSTSYLKTFIWSWSMLSSDDAQANVEASVRTVVFLIIVDLCL